MVVAEAAAAVVAEEGADHMGSHKGMCHTLYWCLVSAAVAPILGLASWKYLH